MTILEPGARQFIDESAYGADLRVSDSLLKTLPGNVYCDPELFDREQDRIFEQMWNAAIRSSDIPNAGDFRTIEIGRESILLTRNRQGEVRGFFNVCRHRGAKVCTQESGEGARAFQCSYHAWTYGLDGELRAAPNLTKMPDVGREDYGLRKVHVHEWIGYIWVSLADEAPDFDETVFGAVRTRLGELEMIEHYGIENLAVAHRIRYEVKANWKLIIENFMECYHCATIHPELVTVLPEFADGYAAQYFVGHGAAFGPGIEGFTVDGSAGAERIPGVTDDQDRRYYAITIRPNVFINLMPDHVVLHRAFPKSADVTIVECDWLFRPEVVEAGTDISGQVELFDRVNRQDFEACELCQSATHSKAYAGGGVLVPSEHHIAEFHEWATKAAQ